MDDQNEFEERLNISSIKKELKRSQKRSTKRNNNQNQSKP